MAKIINKKYIHVQANKASALKTSHLSVLMFNVFVKSSPALQDIATKVSCNLLALIITAWIQRGLSEMHDPCLIDQRNRTEDIKAILQLLKGMQNYFWISSKIIG